MTNIHFAPLFFSILLLFPLVNAYADTSFSVRIQLAPGNVHVIERTAFLLENSEERAAFSNSLQLGKSTIRDWRAYSHNIDYHVSGKFVYANSTRIVAKRDISTSFSPAVVVLEYDVDPSVLIERISSSRVTEYSFNASLLTLRRLQTDDIVLGNIDELTFEIPVGTAFSTVTPEPQLQSHNSVSFKGPLISKVKVSFIQEKTLSEEVSEFFVQASSNAANLISLLLLLAFLLFVWFKLSGG